jgi:hypothetical protein
MEAASNIVGPWKGFRSDITNTVDKGTLCLDEMIDVLEIPWQERWYAWKNFVTKPGKCKPAFRDVCTVWYLTVRSCPVSLV